MLYRDRSLSDTRSFELAEKVKYSKRKRRIWFWGIVVVCILIGVQAVMYMTYKGYMESKGEELQEIDINESRAENVFVGKEDVPAEKGESESGGIFILGEHEGKLAIYSPDGETVYNVFDVYIETLPELDRDMIRGGIRVKSTEELGSLIEDFTS